MTDIFDGDPLVTLGANGAELNFVGGNPVMDKGFENHVNFALLTESGHWSEDMEKTPQQKYKGLFLKESRKPITRQQLIAIDRAAEADTAGDEFGKVTAEAINPESQNLQLNIDFITPTGDIKKLRLERTGANWLSMVGL